MDSTATPAAPKVFISYSHDSATHQEHVLALADRLRKDGLDVMVDQYLPAPPEGWPRWMDQQIKEADFVLLVCTETYLRRVERREQPGKGHGVLWEGNLIYQHLYNAGTTNAKFIPVLLDSANPSYIPLPLQGVTCYHPETDDGYEQLYRRLTNQPRDVKPELGIRRSLPPRTRSTDSVPPTSATETKGPSFVAADAIANRKVTWLRRVLLAGLVIPILLLVGYVAWKYGAGKPSDPAVYRVRVIVLSPQRVPVNDAKVTSSMGGEAMKVEGGWQFVIPAESKPKDGKLTVYADVPNAFLTGMQNVLLSEDRTPTTIVQLASRPSAQIRGIVVDKMLRAVAGAKVSIIGYGSEAVTTQADGSFSLSAHAADGQQVQLHAEEYGYKALNQWHSAGDMSATIVLERR
jgi:hypothetical protein